MQTGEMQRGFEAQTRQMRIDLEHERAQKRSASLLCVGCERHCVPSLALRTVRCGGSDESRDGVASIVQRDRASRGRR